MQSEITSCFWWNILRFYSAIFILQDYWTQPTAGWLGKNMNQYASLPLFIQFISLAPCPHLTSPFSYRVLKKREMGGEGSEIEYGGGAVYSQLSVC